MRLPAPTQFFTPMLNEKVSDQALECAEVAPSMEFEEEL